MDWEAIFQQVSTIVTAVGVIVAAYYSYRAKQRAANAETKVDETKVDLQVIQGEVHEVGERIDGRLSELLDASTKVARAEGVAAGEQAQRDRSAPSDDSHKSAY